MKQKILTIILGMVLLVGLVAAAGTITNLSPSLTIPGFIAGGTTSTEFSFDYVDDGFNNPDASLVLKVDISSVGNCQLPSGDCSVWKGDFQLSGFIEEYSLSNLFLGTIYPLNCVEDTAEFKVQQGLLYTETNISNGTFYCYDPNNYINMLKLDRRDKVNFSISSNPALYPGEYSVSVELMEMQLDNKGPVIELIEPSGENIFSETNEVIPIKLNISDMYNIDDSSVKYKIVSFGAPSDGVGLNASYYDSGWIYDIEYKTSGFYEAEFNMTEHNLTKSGSYWIYAEAKDVLGNEGKL